jgi:hypothetical protein
MSALASIVRRPARLCRERGVVSIEFAFIAPVLVILVVAVFDVALLYFMGLSMESAALNASRYGATGFSEDEVTREEAIAAIVENQTYGMLEDNGLELDTYVYESFEEAAEAEWLIDRNQNGVFDDGEWYDDVNGNGVWDGDPGVPGIGEADEIVVYRLNAEYELFTPFLGEMVGPIDLRAVVAIRNEPF